MTVVQHIPPTTTRSPTSLGASTFTVFDLEFTAWECSMANHWLRPGEFKEVIQIGAVRLDAVTFQILDEFEILIRPRINALLSPYIENLTGITGAMLAARGVDFETGYARFLAFAGNEPICAFGHDEWVLEENIRLYGLKPMQHMPLFHDLRAWFADHQIDPRGLQSCDIGPSLGVPFAGHAHNALDDARSLAAGMEILAARSTNRSAPLAPAA